jgi:tight adherence protein B
MTMTLLIIAVLFFIAALLGLITLYMAYIAVKASPAFELKKRLRKLAVESHTAIPSDIRVEILVEMTPLDKFLYKFKPIRQLDGLIDKAGLKIDIKIFLLIILSSAAAGFLIGTLLNRGIIFSIILLFIAVPIPFIFLHYKRKQRIMRFTEQFANALDMIARSLRAGHSLASAIQMVGSEMSDPVAGLFMAVYEEQTYGLSLNDAFRHMIERMDTVDLRFFVTAVNIYREIGGNLSEILERLAQTIRERIKIRRQVRVYTAQARLSGYILAALPVFVAIFFYIIAPDYIGELWAAKIGRYFIAGAVTAQIIGFFIIRKIINIRI